MFESSQFELIDFGHGRKLESFSGLAVMRDCPAATKFEPSDSLNFEPRADRLDYNKSLQTWSGSAPAHDWIIKHNQNWFQLRPTPFGHLGIFCEQVSNWDWINNLPFDLKGRNAINLFAYTGGTTLALARRGANVVHVDSARNVVRWARENADLSGLHAARIRWIVDDAVKFVEREIKRGNKYDIVVADPPAIGHAGKKLTWKFHRDIELLIARMSEIASDPVSALLLTCHTDGFDSGDVLRFIESSFEIGNAGTKESGSLDLVDIAGRKLNCGHFVRWHR